MRPKTIDLDAPKKARKRTKPKSRKPERVGHGILTWNTFERRSDRYGSFFLGDSPDGSIRSMTAPFTDLKTLTGLVGKRVHVVLKVVEARKSDHIGDMYHGFVPSTPKVGETVDLGVGILSLEPGAAGLPPSVVLEPKPMRDHFWFDPRKLYRLHAQTVDLYVTPTRKPFTPKPNFKKPMKFETEPVSMDVGDGHFQTKRTKDGEPLRIEPDVERLGGGLFIMTPASGLEKGRKRRVIT